jgi:tetratricopeptide (TPR) repeat protein
MSKDIQKAKEHFLNAIKKGSFAGIKKGPFPVEFAVEGELPVDIEGAIAEYTEAIRLYPDYADAYYNRGLLRQQLKDQQQGAEVDIKKAEELFKLQNSTNIDN